jgi:hypothetical protein
MLIYNTNIANFLAHPLAIRNDPVKNNFAQFYQMQSTSYNRNNDESNKEN